MHKREKKQTRGHFKSRLHDLFLLDVERSLRYFWTIQTSFVFHMLWNAWSVVCWRMEQSLIQCKMASLIRSTIEPLINNECLLPCCTLHHFVTSPPSLDANFFTLNPRGLLMGRKSFFSCFVSHTHFDCRWETIYSRPVHRVHPSLFHRRRHLNYSQ
jgi:hypothetical protein